MQGVRVNAVDPGLTFTGMTKFIEQNTILIAGQAWFMALPPSQACSTQARFLSIRLGLHVAKHSNLEGV
jgi:NAD(P)-dependent dehydrogenase (short-subunit alcohol dehydrogenase family)